MTSDIVTAYRNFLQKWNPQDETENELLVNLGKAYSTANFIFGLDGHPEIKLHDTDGEIAQKITELKKSVGPVQGNDICAVTGEKGEISVTHDKIKGVRNANATGALMVCVNNTAECSYGKEQAYNSSITQTTMKHYTEALNTLIADKNHRIYLDDMTVVFWAMSDDDSKETDLFASMLGFDDKIDADEMNGILLKSLNDVNQGKSPDFTELDIDKNVEFYIVGIAPNVSRLAQKFIYRDKFGNIFSHIARHQAPPPLMASVFGAIINGTHYPESLLENAVRRMKTDKSVNYVRAGIIKACINRKDRYSKNKEEIKMALDIENNNQAYLCGRLFAVLEKVQIESVKGKELNRTIKDSYFASACANPSTVFPKLIKLSQYHIEKLDYKPKYKKLTGEIVDKLNGTFPKTLPLNAQGKFIIGYYQQMQDLYKPNDTKTKEI